MPGGDRLQKMSELVDIADLCPTCHKPVLWKKMHSQRQLDGFVVDGLPYHYGGCSPYLQNERISGRNMKEEEAGNLAQEEYRFWVGYRSRYGEFAICRCCRTSTYSKRERLDHFTDEKFAIKGDQCTARLINAYKVLLESASCIICHKQRFNHVKWGVPLCPDTECINSWKFGQDRRIKLEYILEKHKREALGDKTPLTIPAEGIKVIGSPSPKIGPWCSSCCMFADTSGHDEVHAARIQSGCMAEVEYM
jgi:hypothetical protein